VLVAFRPASPPRSSPRRRRPPGPGWCSAAAATPCRP